MTTSNAYKMPIQLFNPRTQNTFCLLCKALALYPELVPILLYLRSRSGQRKFFHRKGFINIIFIIKLHTFYEVPGFFYEKDLETVTLMERLHASTSSTSMLASRLVPVYLCGKLICRLFFVRGD